MNGFVWFWVRFLVKAGLFVAFFTWWSWLWHVRVAFLRGRCDFVLATLREVYEVDGWWPSELVERVEDLVKHGWGAPR